MEHGFSVRVSNESINTGLSFMKTPDLGRKLEEFRDFYNGHRVRVSLGDYRQLEFSEDRSPPIPLALALSRAIPTSYRGLINYSLGTGHTWFPFNPCGSAKCQDSIFGIDLTR